MISDFRCQTSAKFHSQGWPCGRLRTEPEEFVHNEALLVVRNVVQHNHGLAHALGVAGASCSKTASAAALSKQATKMAALRMPVLEMS